MSDGVDRQKRVRFCHSDLRMSWLTCALTVRSSIPERVSDFFVGGGLRTSNFNNFPCHVR